MTNNSIDDTLKERGNNYGDFSGHAQIAQDLKAIMRRSPAYAQGKLSDSQEEALDMIFHKIGRILNGNPDYADSWHDISGYATLVEKQLNGEDI